MRQRRSTGNRVVQAAGRVAPILGLVGLLAWSAPGWALPVPQVTINGATGDGGPVVLKQSETATIAVGMDSGGVSAVGDWWLTVQAPFGLFFVNAGGVNQTIAPIYQGPLVSISGVSVLTFPLAGLSPGAYTFYFGFDGVPNGQIDPGALVLATATLAIATPAARGEPIGPPPGTATIGPTGGTITSADGKVTVSIPVGALASPTSIGIQAITSTVPGKAGRAFRLTPGGLALAQPVEISVELSDTELGSNSLETFALALQGNDGYWLVPDNQVYAQVAQPIRAAPSQTITATLDPALATLDLATLHVLQLMPARTTVRTGRQKSLYVKECTSATPPPPGVHGRAVWDCASSDAPAWNPSAASRISLRDFAVDGILGGNYPTVGTIVGAPGSTNVSYNAPPSVPGGVKEVAATVTAVLAGLGERRLGSFIRVVDQLGFAGRIDVDFHPPGQQWTGSLDVWLTPKDEIQGDIFLKMEGTLEMDPAFSLGNGKLRCVLLRTRFPVTPGPGAGATALSIYLGSQGLAPVRYDLHFLTDPTATTAACLDFSFEPPRPTSLPVLVSVGFVGDCPPPFPKLGAYETDSPLLVGHDWTEDCSGRAKATWKLEAQP